MLRMVLPLIARNRLPVSASRTCQLVMGQRELINPAKPVSSSRPVCKLLINGQKRLALVRSLVINVILISFASGSADSLSALLLRFI